MQPKISVIVPVYKAEKYLHRCVDSILAQTFTDFEVLLINDGSPDNSDAICDEYAKKNNRVRVFHKENGGVSSARNLGLDNAKGEWITFIDSDDYVKPNYLLHLTEHLDADWILSGYQETIGSKLCPLSFLYKENEIISFCNKYNEVHIARACWGGLYKSDIIKSHKITFSMDIRYGEDTLFNSCYIIYCDCIRVVNGCNYIYCNDEITENKYILRVDEVTKTLTAILHYRSLLEKKYKLQLEDKSDAIIFLNQFPLEEFANEQGLQDYYSLCKKCHPDISLEYFISNETYSPIIRLISIIKKMNEEGQKQEFLQYCKICSEVCNNIKICPKFKYKDFYIWYHLSKSKCYGIMNYIMRLYFYFKKTVYRLKLSFN